MYIMSVYRKLPLQIKQRSILMAPTKKTILDHSKLSLMAPKQNNGAYPAKHKVQTYNNNVQLTVFSGVTSAKNSGVISAGMDPRTFYMLIAMIRRLINVPANGQNQVYEIENHTGQGKDKAIKNKTLIGKDAEGMMFISVVDLDDSMPKVKFTFNADYYHKINANGFDKATISCIAAEAWADMFSAIMAVHLTETFEPVQYNGQGGGNFNKGGGNYNQGNNNNNGNRNNSSSSEQDFNMDDIF